MVVLRIPTHHTHQCSYVHKLRMNAHQTYRTSSSSSHEREAMTNRKVTMHNLFSLCYYIEITFVNHPRMNFPTRNVSIGTRG